MARPGISGRVSSYSARTGDGREEEKQMGQAVTKKKPDFPKVGQRWTGMD